MEKHVLRVMIITIVVSANEYFVSPFFDVDIQILETSCKLPFLFPPHCQNALESLLSWA